MALKLSPLNDLPLLVTLREVGPNGQALPVTSGVVSAFLATSNGPTATAAAPGLVATGEYTGNGGRWVIRFDATALTVAVLDALYGGGTTPYAIIQREGSSRVYVPLEYERAKPALIG